MRTLVFKPRSAYIYNVAKSLGFCFRQEKNQNKKLLLKAKPKVILKNHLRLLIVAFILLTSYTVFSQENTTLLNGRVKSLK